MGEATTREQIEADIAYIETRLRCRCDGKCTGCACNRRSLARLRADLARLDGPAEGFVRVRLAVGRLKGSDCSGYIAIEEHAYDEAFREDMGGADPIAIVTCILPRPPVAEVEGTVVS